MISITKQTKKKRIKIIINRNTILNMKPENQNKLNIVAMFATIVAAIATVVGVIIAISVLP